MEQQYIDIPPKRGSSGGRRQAAPPPKPTKQSKPPKGNPVLGVGKVLYGILVAISALIVGGYLAFTFFVSEPEMAPVPEKTPEVVVPGENEQQQQEQPEQQEEVVPKAEPLERREGVYNILLAGTDFEGTRTDTMMVVSYDTKQHTVGVVSVPRDTLVERGKGENPKLVYGSGGASKRAEEISDLLGIPVDYYVKVNLSGFIALVDYVGGVDFYVPCKMDYDDPYQNLAIHYNEGLQHLNGQQAMEVARFRKNNDGSGYTDVGRTQTQQKLLVALGKKVLSWNSLTKLNGFVEIFNQYVTTNLSLNDMLYFASQAVYVDVSTGVNTATLQGNGEAKYGNFTYCYALDQESTVATVNELLNPYTRDLTLDDMNILSGT